MIERIPPFGGLERRSAKDVRADRFSLPSGCVSYRRVLPRHVVVCPFCEAGRPIPTDFDAIHRCSCGACFKVCGHEAVDGGVGAIAEALWSEEELDLIRAVSFEFCNVVVERGFDRLLALRHTMDPDVMERFCKFDADTPLSLVWVKRLV